ncbi:CsbD family protein [Virgibacillus xinjiangensis]|uniref:CsbD family protein n=1 Tax=Virgibacillus xinjiangensis TaxID=393090 RepID=A0ABV7CZR9_9BACI
MASNHLGDKAKGMKDKMKGMGKEEIGRMTGDSRKKSEGMVDRMLGEAKDERGNTKKNLNSWEKKRKSD